eukprot:gnl/Trimastix_PCT/697.p2 GENE.gnl/Trimastix_PCT/697~~gnl/Trimastix_PCT/697.p2  ORF type:complete len:213 (+),score=61.81 gnl/Trimastix_PCT/697:292-930(+)
MDEMKTFLIRSLRSGGYGVVEMDTPEEAKRAIDTEVETYLDGRRIFIREDQHREPPRYVQTPNMRPPYRGGAGFGFDERYDDRDRRYYDRRDDDRRDYDRRDYDRRDYDRRDREYSPPRGRDPYARRQSRAPRESMIYVGNISYETTWATLKDTFRVIGPVARADVMTDPATGRSRGSGTVLFERPEDARRAIDEFDQKELDGRRIQVREYY